jgi:hypothetical protein
MSPALCLTLWKILVGTKQEARLVDAKNIHSYLKSSFREGLYLHLQNKKSIIRKPSYLKKWKHFDTQVSQALIERDSKISTKT